MLIQSLSAPKVRLIAFCKRGLLYIASQTHIWCLQAVPISQQVKTLLEEKQFQLALKLAVFSIIFFLTVRSSTFNVALNRGHASISEYIRRMRGRQKEKHT